MRLFLICALALGSSMAMIACGDDDGPTDAGGDGGADGGTDAATDGATDGGTDGGDDAGDPDSGTPCGEDAECDDGNPCNGTETCDEVCVAGTPLDEGAECDADGDPDTNDYCISLTCTPSRCGDGVTDEDSEECDDANDIEGDGCDNDCTLSCSEDGDCADGEECNGDETCDTDTNACVAGTALDEGTACNGGTGTCMSERCIPELCSGDDDCDDSDPCNGDETCSGGGMCMIGDPLVCDDGDACTAESCVAPGGCMSTLIDGDGDGQASTDLGDCGTDCDDDDDTVFEGAVDACDGKDNDCDGSMDEDGEVTWWVDCDGDGYAAADARSVESCERPPAGDSLCPISTMGGGWTTREPADHLTTDCVDRNANVNPAQTMFFASAIAGQPPASDFDYNCDTDEETETDEQTAQCALDPSGGSLSCQFRPGWVGEAPGCGMGGRYATNASVCRLVVDGGTGTAGCMLDGGTLRTQRCR